MEKESKNQQPGKTDRNVLQVFSYIVWKFRFLFPDFLRTQWYPLAWKEPLPDGKFLFHQERSALFLALRHHLALDLHIHTPTAINAGTRVAYTFPALLNVQCRAEFSTEKISPQHVNCSHLSQSLLTSKNAKERGKEVDSGFSSFQAQAEGQDQCLKFSALP